MTVERKVAEDVGSREEMGSKEEMESEEEAWFLEISKTNMWRRVSV